MRLGRLLRIAALAVWLTAVTWYWWSFVPPAPAHVIPLHGRSPRWTPPYGNLIVLSHTGPGPSRPFGVNNQTRPPSFGPLHLYDPAIGQQIRQALNPEDEILGVVLKPRQLAVFHRDDVVSAVDLSDPRKLLKLDGVAPNSVFVFADGARIVIADSPGETTAFDLQTGERLWSKSNVRKPVSTEHGGSEVVIAELIGHGRKVFRARTGEIDDRLGHIVPVWPSQDGRRFAMKIDEKIKIFDSSQEKALRHVTLLLPGSFPMVQFSPDGKVIRVWEHNPKTRRLTFWDCETGRRLQRQPDPGIPRGPISLNAAWVITVENINPPVFQLIERLPAKAIRWLQRTKMFWDAMVELNQSQVHLQIVTDTFTGETLGRYQVPSAGKGPIVTDDEHGFVAFSGPTTIDCYRVPANRNWLWLIKWGTVPIAAAWSLLFLFRKWRQRRRTAVVVAATA
jgi:hypothetical protein